MWKPKIYIGTSLFDMILSEKKELKRCSIVLLDKCKHQDQYEGFISAFTLFELSKRYDTKKLKIVLNYIKNYDLKFIEYRSPKEIDYLVANYSNASFFPKELSIEYFHISTCAYLNLEFYVCWNICINKISLWCMDKSIHSPTIAYRDKSNI